MREHAVNMGIKTGYKYLAISTELHKIKFPQLDVRMLLMDDAKHKIPTVGCQDVTTKDIVDEHFL